MYKDFYNPPAHKIRLYDGMAACWAVALYSPSAGNNNAGKYADYILISTNSR